MDEPVVDKEPEVTVAVTPAVTLPGNIDIPAAVRLAHDLAVDLYDRDVILKKHGVTDEQCRALEANTHFKALLEKAIRDWFAPSNIRDRLALEAAIGLEAAMPAMVGRMTNALEPLPGVVQAAKVLADIAGAGGQRQQASAGEKFTITINLGSDKQVFEKTAPTIEVTSEGPGTPPLTAPSRAIEVQADGEG